jgi:hypothetical protein
MITDFFAPDVILVRRELRRLLEQYPEAFAFHMYCVQRSIGDSWRLQFPPREGEGDKPLQVDRQMLAMLLADYRNRTGTRDEFLKDLAGKACCNPYSAGKWQSADAIKEHLKDARKLARTDLDFEAEVEALREDLLGL